MYKSKHNIKRQNFDDDDDDFQKKNIQSALGLHVIISTAAISWRFYNRDKTATSSK